MSQGVNGFLPHATQINQHFKQQLHSPISFRENFFGSARKALFQQHQLQSSQVIPPSPINDNLPSFMQHPKCEGSSMIQVSQQFNQFSAPQSPHALRKFLPAFSLQGQRQQVPMSIETVFKTPVRVDPDFKALIELQEIATSGCESAAKIYSIHSKRPYFKKIDLLCDRLRQDLRVTDKAVVNINSHGVAWAIKDFIFVFTRITSAWVIMRDYYYNKSEGMNCVKDALDANLAKDFLEWQQATKNFCKSLQNSFENLQNRDQHNGNRRGPNYGFKQRSNESGPTNGHMSFQRLFDPLVLENSKKAQLEGGYLKSALYQPISTESSPNSSREFDSIEIMLDELINEQPLEHGRRPPLYKRSAEAPLGTRMTAVKSQYRSTSSQEEKMESVSYDLEGTSPMKLENEEAEFSLETLQSYYGVEGAKKIAVIFKEVLRLRGALIFSNPAESLKCFPKMRLDNAISLELVIKNVQNGKYVTVHDVFIALKMVSDHAQALLFYQEADQATREIISDFITGVELTLAKYA